MTKICSKCKVEKDVDEFPRDKKYKDGLYCWCKKCKREYYQLYYIENKEEIDERNKQYGQNHKEEKKESDKKWKEKNKEKLHAQRRQRENEKRKTDLCWKLMKNVSRSIRKTLKQSGGNKRGVSCLRKLSYTKKQLRTHLESLFESWMSWDNYGKYDSTRDTWNIDHIIPQSKLPYDTMDHPNFKKCWALENLRPLKTIDNMKKGNK
jgi:hypothetical protein